MPNNQLTLSGKQVRAFQITGLAILLVWVAVRGVVPGWTTLHSDFGNYFVSAHLVSTGANLDSLYNDEWFRQQMVERGIDTGGKFSPFPPVTSWMMLPLSGLQALAAQRVFVVVNLVFVGLCALAWSRTTGWKYLPSLLMVLGGGASLANNIAFGQVYLVMVTGMLAAIVLIGKNKLLPAGILIGAFTAIKYFPVVIIAGLFLLAISGDQPDRRRYFVASAYSILTIVILMLAQLFYFGTGIMESYFFAAFLPHLQSELSGQGMFSYLFQSWDSLGRNLFVYDPVANPDPLVDWPPGRTVLKAAVTLIVLIISLGVMYLHSKSNSWRRWRVFVSVPALAALTVLPASATYHFILLLFPLALLVHSDLLSTRSRILIVALYIAIGFISYGLAFRLAHSAGVIFAYPRLLMMALLFVTTTFALAGKPEPSHQR